MRERVNGTVPLLIREFQNLNCPNPLGLDCQIQAHCPEIRRIWQSGESIVG